MRLLFFINNFNETPKISVINFPSKSYPQLLLEESSRACLRLTVNTFRAEFPDLQARRKSPQQDWQDFFFLLLLKCIWWFMQFSL